MELVGDTMTVCTWVATQENSDLQLVHGVLKCYIWWCIREVTTQVPDIYAEKVVVSSPIFEAKSQEYLVLFGGGILCMQSHLESTWYQNTPKF